MRRYDPGYVEMKQAIEDGKIGLPLIVHACHRNMNHAATMTSEMSIKTPAYTRSIFSAGCWMTNTFPARWCFPGKAVSPQAKVCRIPRS